VVDHKTAIADELAISADLNHEFSKQAGSFAHYAFLLARAEDLVRQLEEKAELLFAKHYRIYRQKNPKDSKENDCKSYIRRTREYQEAVNALHKAKYNRDILKAGVRAFEMRRDMLIQLGAMFRMELDGTDLKTRSLQSKVKKATRVVRKTARTPRRRRKGE